MGGREEGKGDTPEKLTGPMKDWQEPLSERRRVEKPGNADKGKLGLKREKKARKKNYRGSRSRSRKAKGGRLIKANNGSRGERRDDNPGHRSEVDDPVGSSEQKNTTVKGAYDAEFPTNQLKRNQRHWNYFERQKK